MCKILALLATLTLAFLAPPAWAGGGQGTGTDWIYNSGDHDAQARFVSVGEHIGLPNDCSGWRYGTA